MKKLLQSLFILYLIAGSAMAQERIITGTVTRKESGKPFSKVTVKIKGRQGAVKTTSKGKYSINVISPAVTLEFSYLGYLSQTISSQANVIDIALEEDPNSLTEVVVVGYSTTTKRAFTGTAKIVPAEHLDRRNVSNISQALSGEVAGLQVTNISGQPGTPAVVRIRGFGSVNGNRDPLYVLDGVPFSGTLSSINMADIASATVLKDAAATAIYGSRGANGVIIINTRIGKGKVNFIEADGQTGANMSLLPRYDVIKSPEQFIALGWESLYNQAMGSGDADPLNYANNGLFSNIGIDPRNNIWNAQTGADLIDPVTRAVRSNITRKYDPENWKDYAFQNSIRNDVNIKLGGEADKTNYYASLGYLKDKGYSIKSDFERISGRLNLNHQVKSWLTGRMNLSYGRTETNHGGQTEDSESVFWLVDNMPPIYPLFLRGTNDALVKDPVFGGFQYDYGATGRKFASLTNAIADATYNTNRTDRNELSGNTSLNFKIIDGLTFENTLGVQYYNQVNVNRRNKYYGSSASQNGSIFQRKAELFSYNLLNLLRYRKTFGDHTFEALAAHESTDWKNNIMAVSAYNLIDPNMEDFNNAVVSNPTTSYTERYKLDSYFSQITYSYKDTYFLLASIRRDGSSRFVKNKWGNFGSAGAAWLISNEKFMESQKIFSTLKLKASYGLIGEQSGIGFYPGYDVFNVDNLNDNPAFSFSTKGNPDLTWETSQMFQTGVEFTIGPYLTGAVDYYIKNTTDLIFDRKIGPSIGYAVIKVNDGNLKNQGLEFDLTGHVLKSDNFHLDLGVNGELLKNKITKMPVDPIKGTPKIIDVQENYGWAVNRSVYDFYVRQFNGVDPADGRSIWSAYYLDLNGNGKPDGGTLELNEGEFVGSYTSYIGVHPENRDKLLPATTKTYANATQMYNGKSAIPKIRGAFNLSGGYKGFDFNIQMLYSLGGYAYDGAYAMLMGNDAIGSNNWSTDILKRWQNPNDVTNVPRLSNNLDADVNAGSSRFITRSDYLMLNNVRFGYNVPSKYLSKISIAGLSVWVSGDNLWIHTARKGFNPSTAEAGNSNIYRYLPLSTISAGIKIKF